ncbi:hypothetical protein B0H13DRAFT_357863 [Mycena leptocephala]|nr:hypothetical protein B0H13DRAFT_357863 [Mycena leptocephala]
MDLDALLRTNHPPKPLQEAEIHRLLLNTTTELSQLENTINVVSHILRVLESQRSHLGEYLVALKGALSPIRRIPAETLAEIFMHCRERSLEGDYSEANAGEAPMPIDIEYSSTNTAEAPLLLTHVSSHWRAVALSTPALWNIVRVATTSRIPSTILARSRSLPLSVTFSTPGRIPSLKGQFLRELWELYERLWEVRLHLRALDIQTPIPVTSRSLPILSALSIDLNAGRTLSPVRTSLSELLELFQDAPSLRHFNLEVSFPPPQNLLTTHFPWAQLRSLAISVPTLHIASGILIQCTMLEQGYVGGLLPSTNPPQHPPSTLSRLRHLTVSAEEKQVPLIFFGPLSLPMLETLYLDELNIPSGSLQDLLKRSPFNLYHLTLTMVVMELDDLVEFLHLIPSLKTLSLTESCIADGLFQVFTYDPTSPPSLSLPQLTHLSLTRHLTSGLDGDAMALMIQSLEKYRDDEKSPFPLISAVEIHMGGFRFSGDAEDRLACLGSTGFLLDKHVSRRVSELLGDDYFNSDSEDDAPKSGHEILDVDSEEDGDDYEGA